MADTITLNAGSGGATLATDDAGAAGHVQVVKLAISADGSATAIPADAGNGLDVDVTRVSGTVTVDGSGVTQPISAASLPLPSAAATSTKQSDGSQKSQIVDGSGNVIGATSNALDVNIKSGSSSGTQYTEDAAAAANPVGNAIIVVRDDGRGGSLVSADGDNIALRGNNTGELYVKHTDSIPVTDNSGSLTVDNGGTFAVQVSAALPAGANAIGKLAANSGVDIGDVDVTTVGTITPGTAASSLGKAEDAAHSSGDVGVFVLAVRNDSAAATFASADGDYSPIAVDAKGSVAINDGGNSVTVDASNLSTNVAQINGVTPLMGNGASGTGAPRVTIANDSTGILATVSTVTTVSTLTGGGVAHDGVDSGNPIKIGLKAETSPKGITLVADGDRTDWYGDADGMAMVKLNTSFGDIINERVSNTDGSSTAFSNFSAVASTRNYVTSIAVYNSSATAGFVDFRDGTAGSVLFTMPIPAGGGSVLSFQVPLRQPTTNTALAFDVSGALTTVYISLVGFQSKG